MFKHGTGSSEIESKVSGFLSVQNPVVVIGTAPINMTDGKSINKAELIYTQEEATEKFGGAALIDGFTISEALYAAFNIYKVSPIICINVADLETHKTNKTLDEAVLADSKFTLPVGVIVDSINLTDLENKPVECEAAFQSDGTLEVEVITENITSVKGSYDILDPSKVTDLDVIGGIDPVSLEKEGIEVVNDIFGKYSMIPSIGITPGRTSSEVRAILDTKFEKVNNKWGSFSYYDIPNTLKYGQCVQHKKDENWIDPDQYNIYGKVMIGDNYFWGSICAAMLTAAIDSDNGGVPFESPSNISIVGSGIGYTGEDGEMVDIRLTEDQANLLNENGIATVLKRPNGTVLWGNRTSAFQPGGTIDPKEIWLPYKRMFKYIANTLMINTESSVDRPMTPARAESIKTNMNNYLDGLTNQGKLYGGRVEFLQEENTNMINGQFYWHIYIGTVTPGEYLHYYLEYDSSYMEAALLS